MIILFTYLVKTYLYFVMIFGNMVFFALLLNEYSGKS